MKRNLFVLDEWAYFGMWACLFAALYSPLLFLETNPWLPWPLAFVLPVLLLGGAVFCGQLAGRIRRRERALADVIAVGLLETRIGVDRLGAALGLPAEEVRLRCERLVAVQPGAWSFAGDVLQLSLVPAADAACEVHCGRCGADDRITVSLGRRIYLCAFCQSALDDPALRAQRLRLIHGLLAAIHTRTGSAQRSDEDAASAVCQQVRTSGNPLPYLAIQPLLLVFGVTWPVCVPAIIAHLIFTRQREARLAELLALLA